MAVNMVGHFSELRGSDCCMMLLVPHQLLSSDSTSTMITMGRRHFNGCHGWCQAEEPGRVLDRIVTWHRLSILDISLRGTVWGW
jgi:hypothetical protein